MDHPPTLYPIRTAAQLTGVAPVTLRAWERRYGLLRPTRTSKGHRLYSAEDIELINRLVALVSRGLSIGQARLAVAPAANRGRGVPEGTDAWQALCRRMIIGITQFDEEALEQAYSNALALYPVDAVTRMLLLPVLAELGERWQHVEGGVAEEHFFAVYLRNKLGARFHHRVHPASGPRLLAACLPGEQHEIGLLLWALAASERGYAILLLGANTPLAEVGIAARRTLADGVVLSGSLDPSPDVLEGLPALVQGIDVPVFIGGRAAVRNRETFRRAGAVPVGDETTTGLRQIGEIIPPRAPRLAGVP